MSFECVQHSIDGCVCLRMCDSGVWCTPFTVDWYTPSEASAEDSRLSWWDSLHMRKKQPHGVFQCIIYGCDCLYMCDNAGVYCRGRVAQYML